MKKENIKETLGGSTEEDVSAANTQEQAEQAREDINKHNTEWRSTSDNIDSYLLNRDEEIDQAVNELIDKQQAESVEFKKEYKAEFEKERTSLREKLTKFFKKVLKAIGKGLKDTVDIVPEMQKLADNLDGRGDIYDHPTGKNVMEVLYYAGGAQAFAVEQGIISEEDQQDNKLKKVIGGVNNFLEQNEGFKDWLRDIVKEIIDNQKYGK